MSFTIFCRWLNIWFAILMFGSEQWNLLRCKRNYSTKKGCLLESGWKMSFQITFYHLFCLPSRPVTPSLLASLALLLLRQPPVLLLPAFRSFSIVSSEKKYEWANVYTHYCITKRKIFGKDFSRPWMCLRHFHNLISTNFITFEWNFFSTNFSNYVCWWSRWCSLSFAHAVVLCQVLVTFDILVKFLN